MATVTRGNLEDVRRSTVSPRSKGRENAKDTLCRNVTIYGHCRYQDKGCVFNHDAVKVHLETAQSDSSLKKHLNVDSPSFTPSSTPLLGINGTSKKPHGLSPKAASAAPFKPKSFTLVNEIGSFHKKQYHLSAPEWGLGPPADVSEFVPRSHSVTPSIGETNGDFSQSLYDPYVAPSTSLSQPSHGSSPPQMNPYSQDASTSGSTSYYHNPSYAQPIQYHLYTSLGPHREALLPYQRVAHDFFISDSLREELQRKSAATLQTLPNSTLPPQIEHFHSLVPLDTTNQKNATLFGHPSWIYKAISSKDGNTYALRRLEGFRLTNEKAIRSVQNWKRISNGNVVTVIDAFTNRNFGDSSLIFITDYHPLSKTLAEIHFGSSSRFAGRAQSSSSVTEQVLWSYMVQIANALKAIHGCGLAARLIDASKVILTGKNRVRFNACAILDVVQYDNTRSLVDLQRDDLLQFGRLMLALGTNNPAALQNVSKSVELFGRSYSSQLKDRVSWLLNLNSSNKIENIETFITSIASQMMSIFDNSLHLDDQLNTELNRELENSRIVRLMTKLNFINERPEYSTDGKWAETGERFPIRLFRDYVFHQVDAQGNPVLDLGHVLACLNKLDAGTEEKIMLTSRDEQICIVASYKEMKRMLDTAWQELVKMSRRVM